MINLMGYSVLVDNEEQAKKLQEIAFEQDFEWKFGGKIFKHLNEKAFVFGFGGKKVIVVNTNGEHYQSEYITKKAHFNELFQAKFVPTAMKCTQKQFEAIKPKLKGCKVVFIDGFPHYNYLVNNAGSVENVVTNVSESRKSKYNREVHEEWNEEIFLKNCGIEVDTLEQQLQKAKAEVERLEKAIEEKNKIKVGDWVYRKDNCIWKIRDVHDLNINLLKDCVKITNPELIKLLEQEIK